MVNERNRARILAVLLAAVAALGPMVLATGGWSPPRWFGAVPGAGQNGVASMPGVQVAGAGAGSGVGSAALGRSSRVAGIGGLSRPGGPAERGRSSTHAVSPGLPGGVEPMPPGGGGSVGPDFVQSCAPGAVAAAASQRNDAQRAARSALKAASRTPDRIGRRDGGSPASTRNSRPAPTSRPAHAPAVAAPAWWKVCPVGAPQATLVPWLASHAWARGSGPNGSHTPGRGQPQERGRFEWWNRDRQGDWHGQGHGWGQGQGHDNGHGEGHDWGKEHGHGHGDSHERGKGHHFGH